jgi:choline-sulfatase
MVGDHSPNWGGVPRHDLGVLDKANDPWRESLERSGIGQSAYQVKDADTASAACTFLRNVAKAREAGDTDPFCLSVGFLLPHPPYVAWREDYERFQGRVPPPAFAMPPDDAHPWEAWWRDDRGIADVAPAVTMRARTAYYGLVHRLDAMIGDVLACLRECGLDENTLVVYTTDHGDQLGERGLWWKHTLFEDSVRVPLILRWPGRIAAEERRAQDANLIDVAATMLDALGGEPLPQGRGRSLLPIVHDARAPWLDETFSEHCTDVVPAWTGGRAAQQRMIRRGRFKLIYYHGDAPQLFDLEADPHERNDLAQHAQHAKTRDDLLARVLDGWDPDAISARIRARRQEKDVIERWARSVRPQDAFRWNLLPEHNRLEPEAT